METKTLEISGRKYIITEIDFQTALAISKITDIVEEKKALLEASKIEPKVELSSLNIKDGAELIRQIYDFNGLSKDFTAPQSTKQDTQKS